jgi:hypothetical protein
MSNILFLVLTNKVKLYRPCMDIHLTLLETSNFLVNHPNKKLIVKRVLLQNKTHLQTKFSAQEMQIKKEIMRL